MLFGGAAVWPLAARAQQAGKVWRIGFLSGASRSAVSGSYDAFVQAMDQLGYVEGKDFVSPRVHHAHRRSGVPARGGRAAGRPVAAGRCIDGLANDAEGQARLLTFRRSLQELGWAEGRNLIVDEHWTSGDLSRMRASAKRIVDTTPDVILANSAPVLTALRKETATIPIVFVQVVDPVGQGFVDSLARPGANITGFSTFEPAMGGKWLETLKEIAPDVRRVAYIYSPETAALGSGGGVYLHSFETVAATFAMKLVVAPVGGATDIERAIDEFAREPHGGLLVPPDINNTVHRGLIVELAARYRLPAIYDNRYYTASGGLITYGTQILDLYRRAAFYVGRILKGTKPADLPVQAPTKFELVINLKTAKTLGLDVPPALLSIADEVIE